MMLIIPVWGGRPFEGDREAAAEAEEAAEATGAAEAAEAAENEGGSRWALVPRGAEDPRQRGRA